MHDKINSEIDKVVAELAPPANAVGLLTSDEVSQIVRQAATRGAVAGWLSGERTARAHWGREIDKLRERIKELEMEQIARAK